MLFVWLPTYRGLIDIQNDHLQEIICCHPYPKSTNVLNLLLIYSYLKIFYITCQIFITFVKIRPQDWCLFNHSITFLSLAKKFWVNELKNVIIVIIEYTFLRLVWRNLYPSLNFIRHQLFHFSKSLTSPIFHYLGKITLVENQKIHVVVLG